MPSTEPLTRDDMSWCDDDEIGRGQHASRQSPEHPRDDPRFAVEFDQFPGGWPGWRRAVKRAVAEHAQSLPGDDYRRQDSPGHYAHQQLYYAVKSKVNAAAHRVAGMAEVEHCNFSHWLVKQQGFPWPRDCAMTDLMRLLDFLQLPGPSMRHVQCLNTPEPLPRLMQHQELLDVIKTGDRAGAGGVGCAPPARRSGKPNAWCELSRSRCEDGAHRRQCCRDTSGMSGNGS